MFFFIISNVEYLGILTSELHVWPSGRILSGLFDPKLNELTLYSICRVVLSLELPYINLRNFLLSS